jgi:hypothetical protein
MPRSFARSVETDTSRNSAKHGLGATASKTATAEMEKIAFIGNVLLSAGAKFDERHGAPHVRTID